MRFALYKACLTSSPKYQWQIWSTNTNILISLEEKSLDKSPLKRLFLRKPYCVAPIQASLHFLGSIDLIRLRIIIQVRTPLSSHCLYAVIYKVMCFSTTAKIILPWPSDWQGLFWHWAGLIFWKHTVCQTLNLILQNLLIS